MLNIIVSQAVGLAVRCDVDSQRGSVGWVIHYTCCDGEVLTGDLLAEGGTVDMFEPIVLANVRAIRIGG